MTKEEYEALLKSDYWKGYSYSLIKERNFTCEDCGRRFVNERNKLQVHHLVYRDTNPWSYKPEEVIVLCEDCHKRRHGITQELEAKPKEVFFGDYPQSYSIPSKIKKSFLIGFIKFAKSINRKRKFNTHFTFSRRSRSKHPKKYWKYVLYGFLILFFFSFLKQVFTEERPEENIEETKAFIKVPSEKKTVTNSSHQSRLEKENELLVTDVEVYSENVDQEGNNEEIIVDKSLDFEEEDFSATIQTQETEPEPVIVNEKVPRRIMRRAKRAGVSTEGTTAEILERIDHANAVKKAKRAGVSTDGSTSEILDRITKKKLGK